MAVPASGSGRPAQNPGRLLWEGEAYRRRDRHPHQIASVFGSFVLWRFLYEPLERGGRSIHPLELRLGVEAGCATPALADRVGQWAAQQPQRGVQVILRREHGVIWSCATLRKVTARLAAGLAERRQEAQADKLLRLLEQAFQSRGGRGRCWPWAATGCSCRSGATIPTARRPPPRSRSTTAPACGWARCTWVGCPKPGQATLSDQLTRLIIDVLTRWSGPLPRLAYVTDAGHHPTEYYEQVLKPMHHPCRPGERLEWEWVIDFYHACNYVYDLSETLFRDAGRRRPGGGRCAGG